MEQVKMALVLLITAILFIADNILFAIASQGIPVGFLVVSGMTLLVFVGLIKFNGAKPKTYLEVAHRGLQAVSVVLILLIMTLALTP
ncbi:MAG: hypothetical protein HZC14_02455 [Candidatus Niyogibacteria bacterium]|nr:hypothetical protein [Candidatus Niyogibacteria bacterium]